MPSPTGPQEDEHTRICVAELEQIIESYEKILDREDAIERLLDAVESIHGSKPRVHDVISYGLLLVLLGLRAYTDQLREQGMSSQDTAHYIDTMIVCISYLARRLATPLTTS